MKEKIREDFEMIYMKVTGDLREDISLPWVEDAFVDGAGFKQAYETIWKAREGLCRRFGLDWEDKDLEGIMAGITDLERDLAQRMFYYGMVYTRRGYQRYKKSCSGLGTAFLLIQRQSHGLPEIPHGAAASASSFR